MREHSLLGRRIRELRIAKKMTLRGLGAKLGLSAPFLSDLEHGRRSSNRLPDIARALGVDPEMLELLDGRIDPELAHWLAENPKIVQMLRARKAA